MTTGNTGTGGTYIGDPIPNSFGTGNPYQVPVSYPPVWTYPGTVTTPITTNPSSIALAEIVRVRLVKGIKSPETATIEQRLMNIETSLTVILELLGTILAARQQQIEQSKEEQG
jgi:hypothetical protein